MNDLSFLENYKAIRQRLYPKAPAVVAMPQKVEEKPVEEPIQQVVEEIEREVFEHEPTQTSYDFSQTSVSRARTIIKEVAREMNVSVLDIISQRRSKEFVEARQYIMWRLRNETSWSFPRIGKFLGNRDHTTVMHGVRRWEEKLKEKTDALS